MSIDVGARLKQIRNEQGLSQRKLATLAGVTNGLISLIEQNRTSPSIASLKLILDAIPMTFTEFFDASEDNPDKFVFRANELPEINPLRASPNNQASGTGGISLRQVGGVHKHQIQMLHETYEPGADTGQELYKHDSEEAGVVISGEIELTVAGETATLKAGDGYIFDSRKPHRFKNNGNKRCVIVSACTPPSF
ncbi:MAG: cupin domain-containing protein [Granulosicoccus sp.]